MGKVKALTLSFLGGGIFLSYEILWVRVFSFATKSLPVVFGLVLGVYLMGLALGSLVSRLIYLRKDQTYLFVLPLLYLVTTISCFAVVPLTVFFASHITYGYWWGLIPLGFSTLFMGSIFPLLVHLSGVSTDDAGKGVAFLTFANILGSLVGSLTTGFILMDLFSLSVISMGMAMVGFFCVLISLPWGKVPSWNLLIITILIVLISSGVFILREPVHDEMYKKLMYMRRHVVIPPFKKVIENRSGVICLTDDGVVFGDGTYDGRLSTSFYPKTNSEIELAYLTFLFHPEPKRILVVGLASGAWTQVLANGPGVEKVTAIEINPGYLEIIKESPEVSSLLQNPKVNIVIDDGRRWLSNNADERFDYIVLNTTFHWRNGATNLLSEEFLSLVKAHLNPEGAVLVNTTGSKEVVATINHIFPETMAYGIYHIASESPFNLDNLRFKEMMGSFTVDGLSVLDLSLLEHEETLDHYLSLDYRGGAEMQRSWARGAEIITDNNMITEFP